MEVDKQIEFWVVWSSDRLCNVFIDHLDGTGTISEGTSDHR
jgi:hypothetical protein